MTTEPRTDLRIWRSSGYPLMERRADGRLGMTDAFLRAYLGRAELALAAESCPAEHALHHALAENPLRPVSPSALGDLADRDTAENFGLFLRFRDHLIRHDTIEAAYLALFAEAGAPSLPPLFVDHLTHVLARHMLDGAADPFRFRAGELLFRSQRITLDDGRVLAADEETVAQLGRDGGFGALGQLVLDAATPLRQVELDVLREENASVYWERADRFDTVLELGFTRPGLDALARVLERWLAHLLDVTVTLQPVQAVSDPRWSWHVGLDAEASGMLDDLWHGRELDEERRRRLLVVFRLEFREPSVVRPALRGRPVYLGMATSADGTLRLKPQNLLVNLPLAAGA